MRSIGLFLPTVATAFALTVVAAMALTAPANAAVLPPPAGTYYLQNVQLVGGGTLTGSFTSNGNQTSPLTALDIVASSQGAFTGFEYTLANSTINSATTTQLMLTSGSNTFTLNFSTPLTFPGTTAVNTSTSSETETGGNRKVNSGSIATSVAPEPGSAALLFSVAGLPLAGMLRKRRR